MDNFQLLAKGHVELAYEDEWLCVAIKPSGMPSVPLRTGEGNTLVNALLSRYPSLTTVRAQGRAAGDVGLVHRLDTLTSGLLLVAKTTEVLRALSQTLKSGNLQKRYQAICHGDVAETLEICDPIANHPKNKKKVLVCKDAHIAKKYKGRSARTRVLLRKRLLDTMGIDISWVYVEACVARRHQVRAHLASVGHALVADTLYGGVAHPAIPNFLLHADRLTFIHPVSGKTIDIQHEPQWNFYASRFSARLSATT